MPLKDQLTLPTVNDAIAVRPLSLPVPPGTTERRNLRTERSKTFAHAEKAPDGKEIRTCKAQIGAVCYRDDTGELRSIDTTIRDLGTHVGVEWAPYKFRLHETGIGFDFESREGGQCSVTLTGIGGEKFKDSIKPEVADNTITFRDVRPGCDIVFKCLNERVKTLRILRDDKAPRTFDWAVTSDKPELIDSTLTGTDAAGNQLELVSKADGDVITETWSGETKDKAAVVYPVEIDPSVTVNPVTDADDDGCDVVGLWLSSVIEFGRDSGNLVHAGFRFPGVTVPQGATVDSSTLTVVTLAGAGGGGAGTLYGIAADNVAAFSASHIPSGDARTTANVAIANITATTGQTVNFTTTSVVQEVVNRGGFASGNAIGIVLIASNAGTDVYSKITDLSTSGGTNKASLSITYTAAAGGTAGNLLLLGCG